MFGEYARTKKGDIFIYANVVDEKGNKLDYIMKLVNGGPIKYYLNKDNEIVKHSKNIIDLIEIGDILEIELSEEFVEKEDKKVLIQIGDVYTKETLHKDIDNGIVIKILTILTKEQYMQNCYEIPE